MKIVCVMAVFKRPGITRKTLDLLNRQTYPLHKIVVAGSHALDKISAERAGVEYISYRNQPLSEKWQAGINYAKQFDPDAIMICGSDAWLSTNWCELGKQYIEEGFGLVGKRDFYTCYLAPNSKLKIIGRTYKTRKDPVGSGRLISKDILNKLDWQLYPPKISSSMDGKSFDRLKAVGCKLKVITEYPEMMVLSIKSTAWPTITSYQHIERHGMFVPLDSIKDNKTWLESNFPGSVKDLKDLVPTAII